MMMMRVQNKILMKINKLSRYKIIKGVQNPRNIPHIRSVAWQNNYIDP